MIDAVSLQLPGYRIAKRCKLARGEFSSFGPQECLGDPELLEAQEETLGPVDQDQSLVIERDVAEADELDAEELLRPDGTSVLCMAGGRNRDLASATRMPC